VSWRALSSGDLYERLATPRDTHLAPVAGRGTETRVRPETTDADLALLTAMAPGLPPS